MQPRDLKKEIENAKNYIDRKIADLQQYQYDRTHLFGFSTAMFHFKETNIHKDKQVNNLVLALQQFKDGINPESTIEDMHNKCLQLIASLVRQARDEFNYNIDPGRHIITAKPQGAGDTLLKKMQIILKDMLGFEEGLRKMDPKLNEKMGQEIKLENQGSGASLQQGKK